MKCPECDGAGLLYTPHEVYDEEFGWITDYHEDECPECQRSNDLETHE